MGQLVGGETDQQRPLRLSVIGLSVILRAPPPARVSALTNSLSSSFSHLPIDTFCFARQARHQYTPQCPIPLQLPRKKACTRLTTNSSSSATPLPSIPMPRTWDSGFTQRCRMVGNQCPIISLSRHILIPCSLRPPPGRGEPWISVRSPIIR